MVAGSTITVVALSSTTVTVRRLGTPLDTTVVGTARTAGPSRELIARGPAQRQQQLRRLMERVQDPCDIDGLAAGS